MGNGAREPLLKRLTTMRMLEFDASQSPAWHGEVGLLLPARGWPERKTKQQKGRDPRCKVKAGSAKVQRGTGLS